MMFFSPAPRPAPPPALVYAARFYDPRPKVRTYSHLYLWRVGQTGKGTPLTMGATDDTDPQAAPDGKTIFFIRSRDKQPPSVCSLFLQTKQVRVLFSGAAKSELEDLCVSPRGKNLLVKQTIYHFAPFYPNEKWYVVFPRRALRTTSRLVGVSNTEGYVAAAAWAAADEHILRLHPPVYGDGCITQSGSMDRIILRGSSVLTRKLPVISSDFSLENDVSPDRQFVLSQADKGTAGKLVRIAGEKTVAQWPTAPNETLHWLSSRGLAGITFKGYTPVQFRFYSVPPDALQKSGAPVTVSPAAPSVDLHVNTDAAIIAALKEDDRDLENLYTVEAVPKRDDGFLLGTPWHRGNKGVRFWINAQTGAATLWSKCGPPHPSPSGGYFWSQPGTGFAEIGKRPNGTSMTEAVWSLYVASYANPARLIPVVSGAAFVNGVDWLPNPSERKPKP